MLEKQDHYYHQYRTTDLAEIFRIVSAYPFARIIKNNVDTGYPDIVSAPFIRSSLKQGFEFHMANQNPAFANMQEGGKAVVLISGPNAHISPSWYQDRFKDKPRSHTAPTWNYIEARLQCELKPMDREATKAHLGYLVRYFETAIAGWSFDEMDRDIFETWSSHVTGFEVVVTGAESILKLSQEQADSDRHHVMQNLRSRNQGYDSMLADAMERMI